MKKGIKITAILLAVILLLMFFLPFAFSGKIEGIVKTEGNKMLNAKFDFDKLSISLFRNFPKASISLQNFWLKGVNEFANDTLVRSGELTVTVNLMSLFGSSYEISKLSLDDTWVKAVVLADGKVNWDIMKPDEGAAEESTSEASAFKLQMKKLTIDNLNVIYDDRQANMYADIQNLNATCSGDLGSDRTTLQLDAAAGAFTYKMGGIPFLNRATLRAKMAIDADLVNSKFTFSKNELQLNAIHAGIDGWVALKDPAMDMDLNLVTSEVGFKEILSLVPAIYANDFKNLQTDGTATLTAHAKGIMQGDTLPQFNARLEVKNAMFRYPSLPAGVDQINILMDVKNPGGSADLTEIAIKPFNFRMANNPFELSAEIKTPVSDANFKGNAKGTLNLGLIKQVYPLQDMDLNGIINANLSVAGRMSYVEKEQYDKFQASGTVGLSDLKLTMKDMPDVQVLKSLLTFTPQYLQLSETTVNIGKNDITADSRFENYLAYALQGKTIKGSLNIRSSHFNLNDFMSGTEAEAATDTAAMTLIEVPKNINFTMTANMKEVQMMDMTFNNINGQLLVKDGKVDMRNLSLQTMGGNVVMNGYYSTADIKKPELDAAFKMTGIGFAQAYKSLNMVQQMAPVFENLKGNFSGSMNLRTDLDQQMSPVLQTVQASGNLTTKDLNLSGVNVINTLADAVKKPELKNISVKDMSVDFTIKDGRVATKPFNLKWKDYNLNLSGTTGLDQTIDYLGKIQLPASTGIGKYSTVDLKIGGNFTAPKVSIDAAGMAKQAAEAAKNEALNKVGEKLGLDSAVTANKDSLKEAIKEKAAEKAVDILKNLKKK